MRKSLLFSAVALVASAFCANAQTNMALVKTHAAYPTTNNVATDTRFVVPIEAIGQSLPVNEESAYSVGFWVNRTAISAAADAYEAETVIASLSTEVHENFNGAWVLTADDEGALSLHGCWGANSSGVSGATTGTLPLNEWHYIMITHDNKALKFCVYMDDQKIFEKNMTGSINYTAGDEDYDGVTENAVFTFGGFAFNGAIDDVAVYSRALDEDEALVAYFAPHKLTPEINALYKFDDVTDFTINSVNDGADYKARWEVYSGGKPQLDQSGDNKGGLSGEVVGNSVVVRTVDGVNYYWGVENKEVADTDYVAGREIAEIPTLTVTFPELSFENAEVVFKDKDGNVLSAGDEITYELGDKFYVEAKGINDYAVTDMSRLGRTLNPSDYFYPVYDIRDWREIALNLYKEFVAMTLVNEMGLDVEVVYADGGAVDLEKVEFGKEVVVKVSNTTEASLDRVMLGETELVYSATAGGYVFTRPDVNFTVTVEGHQNQAYTLLVARTEGGTVVVTDQDGNEVASGSEVFEGTTLTITATAEEGYTTDITYNYQTAVSSGYSTEVHGDVVFSVVFVDGSKVVAPVEPVDGYCTLSGNASASQGSAHIITGLTVSDGENSAEVAGMTGTSVTTKHPLYKDATATKFTTKPGKTISITSASRGASSSANLTWMCQYVYVDFDANGVFDVDQTVTNVNGDLVSHTGYNLTKHASKSDTADPLTTSDGTTITEAMWNNISLVTIPSFTLPADMKPGEYRIRYKMDWNSTDPCGRNDNRLVGNQATNNDISTTGGYILDFTLVVEGDAVVEEDNRGGDTPVYQLTLSQTGNGHVEAWSGENGTGIQYADGEGLYEDAPIYFVFVADEGESVESAIVVNNGAEEAGDTAGNFTEHIVKGDVEGSGVFTIVTTAIEGIDADDANAPVEYFNLEGVRVKADSLTTGFYVRRQGKKVEKVFVKK